MKLPVVVAYGVGRDSTAMLIRMWKRGWRPDAILFANVGSEKAGTYEFIPLMREWLRGVGFPPITVVRYTPKLAPYWSLEGNMILNATMPGACFRNHTCTMKFKVEPQNKWTRHWQPAKDAWAAGGRVRKLIGFEANEGDRLKRADARAHSGAVAKDQALYQYEYPLMDWGMTLADCIDEIRSVGLPVPPKSACYFCPNQKPFEVDDLCPEDRARIILMEVVAEPYNKKVHGLWRRPRKCDNRPGSITEYILQQGLEFTPLHEICVRVVLNPKCQKAANNGSHTFSPPHRDVSLRTMLERAGHRVPTVHLDLDGQTEGVYLEDTREVPPEEEFDEAFGVYL